MPLNTDLQEIMRRRQEEERQRKLQERWKAAEEYYKKELPQAPQTEKVTVTRSNQSRYQAREVRQANRRVQRVRPGQTINVPMAEERAAAARKAAEDRARREQLLLEQQRKAQEQAAGELEYQDAWMRNLEAGRQPLQTQAPTQDKTFFEESPFETFARLSDTFFKPQTGALFPTFSGHREAQPTFSGHTEAQRPLDERRNYFASTVPELQSPFSSADATTLPMAADEDVASQQNWQDPVSGKWYWTAPLPNGLIPHPSGVGYVGYVPQERDAQEWERQLKITGWRWTGNALAAWARGEGDIDARPDYLDPEFVNTMPGLAQKLLDGEFGYILGPDGVWRKKTLAPAVGGGYYGMGAPGQQRPYYGGGYGGGGGGGGYEQRTPNTFAGSRAFSITGGQSTPERRQAAYATQYASHWRI